MAGNAVSTAELVFRLTAVTPFPSIGLQIICPLVAVSLSVPKELRRLLALLSKLQSGLHLTNNPWEEPPEAVLKKGMRAVSEYFTDLFAEGTTFRRRMVKVVLVGQEGAGKTR